VEIGRNGPGILGVKIGDFFFTSIVWMNVEIFYFIVIFYIVILASPQI
jgi:hypothetical protein